MPRAGRRPRSAIAALEWRQLLARPLLGLILVLLPSTTMLPAPAQAFLAPAPHRTMGPQSTAEADRRPRPLRTRCYSDAFFNFEALKRKLNLTHFSDPALDQAPPLPEEDFGSRPDLVKAKEIGRTLRQELDPEAHLVTVSLYFHVAHHHLQSYREALEVGQIDKRERGGEEESAWRPAR